MSASYSTWNDHLMKITTNYGQSLWETLQLSSLISSVKTWSCKKVNEQLH